MLLQHFSMHYNDSGYQPSIGYRLGAGLSYLILAIFSLIINLLVIYAMFKHRRFFLTYPFYVLTASILVASIGDLIICQFGVAIPISLAGKPIYGEGALMITLSSFDTLFFLTIFWVSFLISVNRFASTFSYKLHWILFEGKRLYIICTIPWLLGLTWCLVTTLINCPKVFRHDYFYFTYNCPSPMDSGFQSVFMEITFKLGYVVPALMMVFYICVLIYVRIKRTETSSHSAEINILIQALLICCAFEIETLLFTFLPDLSQDWGVHVVSLLLDYALFLNLTLYPLILIVMNPIIKLTIAQRLGCWKKPEVVLSNAQVFDASNNPSTIFPKSIESPNLLGAPPANADSRSLNIPLY